MRRKFMILTATLMALAMVFCSCTSVKEIKSTDEEARVVATCGDHEIRYEELRYLTMNYKAEMENQYGEGIFEDAQYEQELRDRVTDALLENYSLIDLCKTEGISINDKTSKKQVQEYVDESVDMLGDEDAYRSYLAESYMTDWVFRLNTAVLGCQQRYYDVLVEQNEKEAYDAVMAGEGIIRCMSIFVRNDKGEDVEANRSAAQKVRDDVAAGATIEDYIGTRYNQDTSSCDYYFMRGYFLEEYEEAAFALEVGEVSEVVEVSDGFYVIQRMEVDQSYVSANVESMIVMYHVAAMENARVQIAQSLSVQFNELGQSIALWSMK